MLSPPVDPVEAGDAAPVLEALPLLLAPVPVGEAAPELVGSFVAAHMLESKRSMVALPDLITSDMEGSRMVYERSFACHYLQTWTPAPLQISASAARASFVSSPHVSWTCFTMSFEEQTALMSAGDSCSFTAPRRQPGLAAEATVAMAANAATKMVLENMLVDCVVR